MSLDNKELIYSYILEKIDDGQGDVAKRVADAFDISLPSVYKYIADLEDKNLIVKEKRGVYRILSQSYKYSYDRSAPEFQEDNITYVRVIDSILKDLPRNVREIWAYSFCEMMNNAIDHSQSETVSINIIKNSIKTTIILSDQGIGIFNKIKMALNLETTEDAIAELMKGKLTTDKERHSGEGIFFTSRMLDEFIIVSGKDIFSCNRIDEESLSTIEENIGIQEPQVGTTIYMSLSNTSTKHAKDIFDEYSDVNSGFTKTRIYLSRIFDAAPVSRSQAKRICNRLEEFKDVELDFSDVEWMGQGFAHQLFVVFVKEHPEINIIPINMEESVNRMYLHVINA